MVLPGHFIRARVSDTTGIKGRWREGGAELLSKSTAATPPLAGLAKLPACPAKSFKTEGLCFRESSDHKNSLGAIKQCDLLKEPEG